MQGSGNHQPGLSLPPILLPRQAALPGKPGHNPFGQLQRGILERRLGCRLFRNVHRNAGLAIHDQDIPGPGLRLELDPGLARNEVAFPRPKRAESLPR